MTDHRTRAGVDCPRCGQRYVDVDVHAYLDAGHTPDDFADMLERLTRAHADTCHPTRPQPTPADRRHRRWWWARKSAIPTLLAITAVASLIAGQPLAALTIVCAAAVVAMAPSSEILAYRAGYWRGRVTSTRPVVPNPHLHPADEAWLDTDHREDS